MKKGLQTTVEASSFVIRVNEKCFICRSDLLFLLRGGDMTLGSAFPLRQIASRYPAANNQVNDSLLRSSPQERSPTAALIATTPAPSPPVSSTTWSATTENDRTARPPSDTAPRRSTRMTTGRRRAAAASLPAPMFCATSLKASPPTWTSDRAPCCRISGRRPACWRPANAGIATLMPSPRA